MLPAASRLRRRVDFHVTVRSGRRASRGALVVHLAAPAPDSSSTSRSVSTSRAGFVVSKAVGGAVTRNRVKRRLRHLVGERLDTLPAESDLVVRALPTAATRSYAQLAQDLDAALAAVRNARRRGSDR